MAAMMRVSPFAWVVIDQNGNAPVITAYSGRNGVGTGDRPTVRWVPSINRTRIEWPGVWRDELGVTHRIRIRGARGAISGQAGFLRINDITHPSQLDIAPVNRTTSAVLSDRTYLVKVY
jgi:hypothetical protein